MRLRNVIKLEDMGLFLFFIHSKGRLFFGSVNEKWVLKSGEVADNTVMKNLIRNNNNNILSE